MAAANLNATQDAFMALVSAPLFYGPKEFVGTPPGAISPEHYVQRVDELAT